MPGPFNETSAPGSVRMAIDSGIRLPFKEGTLRQDGGRDVLDVPFRDATGEEALSIAR